MDFIPENEQGVVLLWGSVCHLGGWSPVWIRTSFPDGCFERDGVEYLIEFEYAASNFLLHGHDVNGCDIIVCWKNDLPDLPIRIIELSNKVWHTKEQKPYSIKDVYDISVSSAIRVQKLRRKIQSVIMSDSDIVGNKHGDDSYFDTSSSEPSRKRLESARAMFDDLLSEGIAEVTNMTELAEQYDVSRQTMYNIMNDACGAGLAIKITNGYRIVT